MTVECKKVQIGPNPEITILECEDDKSQKRTCAPFTTSSENRSEFIAQCTMGDGITLYAMAKIKGEEGNAKKMVSL